MPCFTHVFYLSFASVHHSSWLILFPSPAVSDSDYLVTETSVSSIKHRLVFAPHAPNLAKLRLTVQEVRSPQKDAKEKIDVTKYEGFDDQVVGEREVEIRGYTS